MYTMAFVEHWLEWVHYIGSIQWTMTTYSERFPHAPLDSIDIVNCKKTPPENHSNPNGIFNSNLDPDHIPNLKSNHNSNPKI